MTVMNAVREFERLNRRSDVDRDAIACPKCKCHWFESVEVMKYPMNHHVGLGQKVPPMPGEVGFQLLRCVRCAELVQPTVLAETRDMARGDYDRFLDELEGKGDIRKQLEDSNLEPRESSGAVRSERL